MELGCVIILFFSTSPIEDRIAYIEKHYYGSVGRVLWPLLKAVLLAVIIPAIMLGIDWVIHNINKGRRKLRNETNLDKRKEESDQAEHEFLISEKRTGKKSIEEWEQKVIDEQRKTDVIRESIESKTKFYENEIAEQKKLNERLTAQLNLARTGSYESRFFKNSLYDTLQIPIQMTEVKIKLRATSERILDTLLKLFPNYVDFPIGAAGPTTPLSEIKDLNEEDWFIINLLNEKGFIVNLTTSISLDKKGRLAIEYLKDEMDKLKET